MRITFWNTKNNVSDETLATLIETTDTDVLVLAEYTRLEKSFKKYLLDKQKDRDRFLRYAASKSLSLYTLSDETRITVFTKFTQADFYLIHEDKNYSVYSFTKRGRLSLLFGFVHLSSKKYTNEEDQADEAENLHCQIKKGEQKVQHKNTLIVGDFNMNPFERGMVSAKALNAISCLKTAQNIKRNRQNKDYLYFYNPSWSLLGDYKGTPGTYFYSEPHLTRYYWHLLDQVILRPELDSYFDRDSLDVLTHVGSATLLDKQGRPDKTQFSDHLPITFTLRTR